MSKHQKNISKKTLGPLVKVTKKLNLQTIKSTENKFKLIMDSFDSHNQSQEVQIDSAYFADINRTINDKLDYDLSKALQNHDSSPNI